MNKLENIIAEYKAHTGKKGQMTIREMKLIEICFHHFVQNQPKMVVNISGPTHSEILKAAHRTVKQYIKEDTPMLAYVKMKDVFKDAVKWLQDYQGACASGGAVDKTVSEGLSNDEANKLFNEINDRALGNM